MIVTKVDIETNTAEVLVTEDERAWLTPRKVSGLKILLGKKELFVEIPVEGGVSDETVSGIIHEAHITEVHGRNPNCSALLHCTLSFKLIDTTGALS